jgi:hypothetical protein
MRAGYVPLILLSAAIWCAAQETQINADSLVIVLKDGHEKNYSSNELKSIDFKDGSMVLTRNGRQEKISVADVVRIDLHSRTASTGRNRFVGKWKVGVGSGGATFFITLDRNGQAKKSMGASHGTWEVVNGEARISWDDGWHDIIRKVGDKHEKVAFEPGKSFDAEPSNVTNATNTTAQPI